MATVTRIVRSPGQVIHPPNSEGASPGSRFARSAIRSYQEGELVCVGLLLQISPELAAEADVEEKLFVCIPRGTRTVGEFKQHLQSTGTLKTRTPYFFYNGDYRISDKDDVCVFSLLNEPCRVSCPKIQNQSSSFKTPSPGSLLSVTPSTGSFVGASGTAAASTPLSSIVSKGRRMDNGSSSVPSKKVKFNEDVQARIDEDEGDAVRRNGNGLNGFNNECENEAGANDDAGDGEEDGSRSRSKKQKRKRHRKHKRKTVNVENEDKSEDEEIAGSESAGDPAVTATPSSQKSTTGYDGDISDLSQLSGKFKETPKLSKSTANDSAVQSGGEFLSPNTAFSQTGYKPVRAYGSSSKKEDLAEKARKSDSGYASNASFIDSEGKRKDTPILPRVLKNPAMAFDFAKSLSFGEDPGSDRENEKNRFSPKIPFGNGNSCSQENGNASKSKKFEVQRELKSIAEVEVGETISFKILELNENYCPEVSSPKIAKVIGKDGTMLHLEEIAGVKKQRSGVFEIMDEDLQSNMDDQTKVNFAELIEPAVVVILP